MKRIVLAKSDIRAFDHLMNMYSYYYDTNTASYVNASESAENKTKSNTSISIQRRSDDVYKVTRKIEMSSGLVSSSTENIQSIESLISYMDVLAAGQSTVHASYMFQSSRREAVMAGISSRDMTKNLTRVKSSNIWAYCINIRDRKDKTGDVITQFKGPKGGPGDIYIYYDVPVTLWRRWIGAPSKGHFFWQYIRNNFKYSKLTGNKRGVLKNAINRR